MLQRLRQLFGTDTEPEPESNSEVWLQRMTYQGGWERYELFPDAAERVHPEELRERPTADDDFRLPDPGRYRAILRVDGRLDEVLWTYETADAEVVYDRRRRKQAQRDRLQEMSRAELNAELKGETNELDELDYGELKERFEKLERGE